MEVGSRLWRLLASLSSDGQRIELWWRWWDRGGGGGGGCHRRRFHWQVRWWWLLSLSFGRVVAVFTVVRSGRLRRGESKLVVTVGIISKVVNTIRKYW